ncbi:MAG: MBL fold metallo-hydrolase [Cyanophyceae cyanobacterium]
METTSSTEFSVRFWGVRGSIPAPGKSTIRYGGNTSCIEMHVGGRRLIFDGGTGLRMMSNALPPGEPFEGYMFFTHYHWDHIQGVPFFKPLFREDATIAVFGAKTNTGEEIEHHFSHRILHNNSPIPLSRLKANLTFENLTPGDKFTIAGDIHIETGQLNHPNGAMGYRVTWNGKTIVYATDTEHLPDRLDEQVVNLARGADVLIYDAMYTDEEYHSPQSSKVGWGHSTWQEGLKVAKAAGVKHFAVFHHEPNHSDDFLDDLEVQVKAADEHAFLAKEGMEFFVQ